MPYIHTQLVGTPKTIRDDNRPWRSAIFRAPIAGPLTLTVAGLVGDQVADKKHHGSLDQAVCAHPIDHYDYWNRYYRLTDPELQLGPGGVGENWTMVDATEAEICIGDVFRVGTAEVQVSAPRYPCTKQEKKTKLEGFHSNVIATLRTGYYLRVLQPGSVNAGDAFTLVARPNPTLTIQRLNEHVFRTRDVAFAETLYGIAELAEGWKGIVRASV
jgi:MOSC domain-containing protein YiiM